MLYVGNKNKGFVSIFRIDTVKGLVHIGKIQPQTSSANGKFGSSLAVYEDHLFVGDPSAENGTDGSGKVYSFKLNQNGTYQQKEVFYPTSLKKGESFADKIQVDGTTIGVSAGTKTLYFYQIKKEKNEVQTTGNPTEQNPRRTEGTPVVDQGKDIGNITRYPAGENTPLTIEWEENMENSVNDVIATLDGNWLVGGNSNEKVNEIIKSIESGTSSASGGPEESVSRVQLKHHTGKLTFTQWPMSAPDLFSVRHGNKMIYEKAYGHPSNAGKSISMKFGNSIPVTANTNGKSQTKGSGHPGNIDVIEFGKGPNKGNESLSMEIVVNRSGQKGTGTKWDMKYLIEYDPIVEIDRSSADFQLTKINQAGKVLWSKSYAGDEKDVLQSISPSRMEPIFCLEPLPPTNLLISRKIQEVEKTIG